MTIRFPAYVSGRQSLAIFDGEHCNTIKGLMSGEERIHIDFNALIAEFNKNGPVVEKIYYSVDKMTDKGVSEMRQLFDWLAYNDYTVATQGYNESLKMSKARARICLMSSLMVTVIKMLLRPNNRLEVIYLISSDTAWLSLINFAQALGVKVVVVAGLNLEHRKGDKNAEPENNFSYVAEELRKSAAHVYLSDLFSCT